MGDVGALARRELAGIATQQRGHGELVKLDGEQGLDSAEQRGDGTVFVDREIVHDRIHREGERGLEFAFRGQHNLREPGLGFGATVRGKNKTHAAAGHAAEHPESPEIVTEGGAGALDELLGVAIAHPRNHRLQRAKEIFGERTAEAANVAGGEQREDVVERGDGSASGTELGLAAEEIFFRGHLEDRTDVLGHAAVDEHERILEFFSRRGGNAIEAEKGVARQQATATDAVFGVAGLRAGALDEFDARPEAAGILPTAAGAADPFAEDGAGGDDATLGFVARTVEGANLAGRAHANADERAEEIGRNGEARAFRDAVDVADEFEATTGAENRSEQRGEARAGAFDAGRDEPGGDDGGF